MKPIIRTPTQGRTVAIVGDVYRFLATGEETNGRYALWEAVVPPGGGPPPHVHSREEEGFFVLEGEITFQIAGERAVATAGTFASMPVGTPHSFKNESGRPARMLISVAPAGLEKMFFEVGVPVAQGATAGQDMSDRPSRRGRVGQPGAPPPPSPARTASASGARPGSRAGSTGGWGGRMPGCRTTRRPRPGPTRPGSAPRRSRRGPEACRRRSRTSR